MSDKRKELDKLLKNLPEKQLAEVFSLVEKMVLQKKPVPSIIALDAPDDLKNIPENERFTKIGRFKGQIEISEDFDDPLQEFEDYR